MVKHWPQLLLVAGLIGLPLVACSSEENRPVIMPLPADSPPSAELPSPAAPVPTPVPTVSPEPEEPELPQQQQP